MSALDVAYLYASEKEMDRALKKEDRMTLYRVIPELYGYFKKSEGFSHDVEKFMAANSNDPALESLKRNFSVAAQKMEGYAQDSFIRELQCRSETEKIDFIRSLGEPLGRTPYAADIEFERIPELHAEYAQGGMTSDSRVLILGAGSISISGLYFASQGAVVHLMDRDPAAYENFSKIYPFLPEAVKNNIVMEPMGDARDFDYPEGLTHILVAGLIEPKNPVLEALADYYRHRPERARPVVLMRVPKRNLFQLFYYDTDGEFLQDFQIDFVIDIGYEQSTYTYKMFFRL